jgi:hypothetical protein
MRIQIKTTKPVKDRDIRALYLVNHALSQQTQKMRVETIRFFADKLGYKLAAK